MRPPILLLVALALAAGCTPARVEVRRDHRVAAKAARVGYIPPPAEGERPELSRMADGRSDPGWGEWAVRGASVTR